MRTDGGGGWPDRELDADAEPHDQRRRRVNEDDSSTETLHLLNEAFVGNTSAWQLAASPASISGLPSAGRRG